MSVADVSNCCEGRRDVLLDPLLVSLVLDAAATAACLAASSASICASSPALNLLPTRPISSATVTLVEERSRDFRRSERRRSDSCCDSLRAVSDASSNAFLF